MDTSCILLYLKAYARKFSLQLILFYQSLFIHFYLFLFSISFSPYQPKHMAFH